MPDICMCHGRGCLAALRETCYRHRAVPNKHWQSYFVTSPIRDGKCEHYMQIEDSDRLAGSES